MTTTAGKQHLQAGTPQISLKLKTLRRSLTFCTRTSTTPLTTIINKPTFSNTNSSHSSEDECEEYVSSSDEENSLVNNNVGLTVRNSKSQPSLRKVSPVIISKNPSNVSSSSSLVSLSNCGELVAVERTLPNGDLYTGTFLGNAPHGHGKYLWRDGCMYEGEWRRGKASGKGKFSWPSGATYEGEFKGGRMNGKGTYTGTKGDTYRGMWVGDKKEGKGEKLYENGDVYEGEWRDNVQDGEGKYVWKNGNVYVGEWKNGVIFGNGVLIWCNGNKYQGVWENGVPKGVGVFSRLDGSSFSGKWGNDVMEGGIGVDVGGMEVLPATNGGNGRRMNFPRMCIWEAGEDAENITCDIIDKVKASKLYRVTSRNSDREFGGGGVWKSPKHVSLSRSASPRPCHSYSSNLSPQPYWCGGGADEIKKPGSIISKGHKNYELMLNLQLGIRHSVGKHAMKNRDLKGSDFEPKEKYWTRFPPAGSKHTPLHQSVDFRWKDYCPMVFRHLRELFGIDPAEYMLAICGSDALREFSSPGKSGCCFYLTQDDRYMIKTVKKAEVKVLIKMLPKYYEHVSKYNNTLITKFFGVHCVKPVGGLKTRFIIMGNLFHSKYRIHKRFDLKGSSYGRSSDKPEGEIDETTTLKDLDLDFVFRLQHSWFQELLSQVDRDCEFLEAEKIMDYSLLIGIHFREDSPSNERGMSPTGKSSPNGYEMFNSEMQDAGWVMEGRRPFIRLGINMPARAERVSRIEADSNSRSGTPQIVNGLVVCGDIHEVILYFGMIDILQDYDISKKLEHAYKSLQVDSTSISAVDPKLYSKRFRDFMHQVFVEDE